ncbi:uncharacterized protein [Rutidosis leptorrhynchoides]|uniref:uncharacterized protein n=1 Tax=Rutidosis leptorrhynchoides TaxID=125765 RepID=UPI003A996549
MVLGPIANKKKNGSSINHVDYLIDIQEIKPWPPTQSLKTLQSVFIQWENNGERKKSGSTKIAVPSIGKIEFKESFRFRATFLKTKGKDISRGDVTFQKNLLEFSLYEPRRDNNKSQLLANSAVDLAEYGNIQNVPRIIHVPMNCKRNFSKIQPVLYLKIQPAVCRSSSKNGSNDIVSNLVNKEYAEEVECGSILDDDDSSNSSTTVASSTIFESTSIQNGHAEEKDVLQNYRVISGFLRTNERKDAKNTFPRNSSTESKIENLEHKVKMLESELREAAAIEAAIYSISAEHGNSISRIHAPARRLSRLYFYACKESLQPRKACAARNVVSGLVLAAKACGNDVTRLTFWLSNCVVLRAIISQSTEGPELPISCRPTINRNREVKEKNETCSTSCTRKTSSDNWEDSHTFTSSLEMIESWIFTRIVESIWWQTLTPPMQSSPTKETDGGVISSRRKKYSKKKSTSSGNLSRGNNLSVEIWNKAFKDAFERICHVRAAGHECGCLPMLAKLIMEQCVARLDVAMFNAILRQSSDEIPTDPVSDPITDSKVLPIPAEKFSFGAGAQLKNAIGNWSRWLTNLFGLDDDDSNKDGNEYGYNDEREDSSFKSFHLLNALSDLMMLPKDLLLNTSVRKEVCPVLGAPLIKRVLHKFVPDEFCPDPLPHNILEILESQGVLEAEEDSTVTNFPCIAAAPVYRPLSVSSIACFIGGDGGGNMLLRRSGSSVDEKSYTSDDELDELNFPMESIFTGTSQSSSVVAVKPRLRLKETDNHNAIRYKLLRDVWINSE